MIKFHKYQDVQNRLDIKECDGLLKGIVTIQPKLDGSNCQLWWDGEKIVVSSRTRILGEGKDNDNHGCYAALHNDERYKSYFQHYPNHKLCGEWLIPNHIKYRADAYRKFYVFDIVEVSGDEEEGYAKYLEYNPQLLIWLDYFKIERVPSVRIRDSIFSIIKEDLFSNPDIHIILHFLIDFLLEESAYGKGEGIVIKNYGYKNPFGRSSWCKIINKAYYDNKHIKKEKKDRYDSSAEEAFVEYHLSNHLFAKILHKIGEFENSKVKEFIITAQADFKKDFCIDVTMFDENDSFNSESVKRSLTIMRNIIAKRAVNFLKESNLL